MTENLHPTIAKALSPFILPEQPVASSPEPHEVEILSPPIYGVADPIKLTKASIQEHAANVAQEGLTGEVNPLELYLGLRYTAEVAEAAMALLKADAMTVAARHSKQPLWGVQVEVTNGATRYTYDHNPEYAELKARLKALEAEMQNLAKSGIDQDADTPSHIVARCAIAVPSAETLKVSFPK